jgi:hypothetical protein
VAQTRDFGITRGGPTGVLSGLNAFMARFDQMQRPTWILVNSNVGRRRSKASLES